MMLTFRRKEARKPTLKIQDKIALISHFTNTLAKNMNMHELCSYIFVCILFGVPICSAIHKTVQLFSHTYNSYTVVVI